MNKHSIQQWSERTATAGQAVLEGRVGGLRGWLPFLGPAIIASIAYMDPGNFATNIQSGAHYGYALLWVVLLANVIAMLFQALSAKLGIVTGRSLAEEIRNRFPRPLVYCIWAASEIAAMATDLAETVGGAVGLSILFGLPLLWALAIVALITYGILHLQGYGFRPMEIVIGAFVSIISLSYLAEILLSRPDWGSFLFHSVAPQLPGEGSLLLAVSIIGATVMPHAIYLHSSLARNRIPTRSDAERRRVLWYSNGEVLAALGVAGLVNMAMLAMSAAVFYFSGHQNVADIGSAYQTLMPLMGVGAAGIFLLSLLASGLSSSVVGTMAGQTIMQDFTHFSIPLWVRRLVMIIPAFVVVLMGVNATQALIISQVVLSLVLPIPIVSLLILTSRRAVMGVFANGPIINTFAGLAGAAVLGLNIVLLMQIAGAPL
ncbi:MAG: Nramp family divalent metal transporter [Patescibacteria group bacterium]|nr:Nramp family divalent metal transporter [Patescibacteria group bacterium]